MAEFAYICVWRRFFFCWLLLRLTYVNTSLFAIVSWLHTRKNVQRGTYSPTRSLFPIHKIPLHALQSVGVRSEWIRFPFFVDLTPRRPPSTGASLHFLHISWLYGCARATITNRRRPLPRNLIGHKKHHEPTKRSSEPSLAPLLWPILGATFAHNTFKDLILGLSQSSIRVFGWHGMYRPGGGGFNIKFGWSPLVLVYVNTFIYTYENI